MVLGASRAPRLDLRTRGSVSGWAEMTVGVRRGREVCEIHSDGFACSIQDCCRGLRVEVFIVSFTKGSRGRGLRLTLSPYLRLITHDYIVSAVRRVRDMRF